MTAKSGLRAPRERAQRSTSHFPIRRCLPFTTDWLLALDRFLRRRLFVLSSSQNKRTGEFRAETQRRKVFCLSILQREAENGDSHPKLTLWFLEVPDSTPSLADFAALREKNPLILGLVRRPVRRIEAGAVIPHEQGQL